MRLDIAKVRRTVRERLVGTPSEMTFGCILANLAANETCDLTEYGSVWPLQNGVLFAADYWKDATDE